MLVTPLPIVEFSVDIKPDNLLPLPDVVLPNCNVDRLFNNNSYEFVFNVCLSVADHLVVIPVLSILKLLKPLPRFASVGFKNKYDSWYKALSVVIETIPLSKDILLVPFIIELSKTIECVPVKLPNPKVLNNVPAPALPAIGVTAPR